MRLPIAFDLALALAAPLPAQTPGGPAAAARDFQLDLGGTEPRPPAATAESQAGGPSLDTPIEQLIADPRARAVLDRNLPGLSEDENLPRFKALSLRRFQPLTGGQLTDALLERTGKELAALGGTSAPAARRRKDTGR